MYCPECGTDAGKAKFCPECGADLRAFRQAKAAGDGAARGKDDAGRPEPSRGPSARLLWIVVAVVAAVVAGVVLFTQLGGGGGEAQTTGSGPASAAPVAADLSGSYEQLVERANGLYDQGKALFDQDQIDQGAEYFAAAAKVYEAAWTKQPGDPAVGTDWAVALFYSGDIEGAVDRVEVVLKEQPKFQKGWLNKGIFLTHLARVAEQMQRTKEAARLYDQARQAFVKAVAIDSGSDAGKAADAALADLPK